MHVDEQTSVSCVQKRDNFVHSVKHTHAEWTFYWP